LTQKAAANNRAVAAFNIDNLESALAVTEVMRERGTPVIVQTIPRTLNYGGISVYAAMLRELTADCDVDYAMHLDHGSGLALAEKCIKSGYSSVMFDGSALPFDENVIRTREVADFAHGLGVSAEGELGTIGGKEESDAESEASYTKADEAAGFVRQTGVDLLAIGVGTAHGVYRGTPKINVTRVREISRVTDASLVLHGASGLSDAVLRDCIAAGISKINFATELRIAYTSGIKKGFELLPGEFDPKLYMRIAVDEIKKVLNEKIDICESLTR